MDRVLLLAARGLRPFGFGFAAVLIGVHVERRGLNAAMIGLTLGVGLAAASLSGLLSASLASRFGRRRVLAGSGLLLALEGAGPGAGPPAGTARGGGNHRHARCRQRRPRSVRLCRAGSPCRGCPRRQAECRLRALLADRRLVS